MFSTERKLSKTSEWREIYEQQLPVLVVKGFAKEISQRNIKAQEDLGHGIYIYSASDGYKSSTQNDTA